MTDCREVTDYIITLFIRTPPRDSKGMVLLSVVICPLSRTWFLPLLWLFNPPPTVYLLHHLAYLFIVGYMKDSLTSQNLSLIFNYHKTHHETQQ